MNLTISRSADERTVKINVEDNNTEKHIITLTHREHGFDMMDDIQSAIESTARALGAQISYKELED